jgi:hypothetical protein
MSSGLFLLWTVWFAVIPAHRSVPAEFNGVNWATYGIPGLSVFNGEIDKVYCAADVIVLRSGFVVIVDHLKPIFADGPACGFLSEFTNEADFSNGAEAARTFGDWRTGSTYRNRMIWIVNDLDMEQFQGSFFADATKQATGKDRSLFDQVSKGSRVPRKHLRKIMEHCAGPLHGDVLCLAPQFSILSANALEGTQHFYRAVPNRRRWEVGSYIHQRQC